MARGNSLDDVVTNGIGGRRRSRADAELGEDVADVRVDRAATDRERLGDLGVGSLDDQAQHLDLAGCQRQVHVRRTRLDTRDRCGQLGQHGPGPDARLFRCEDAPCLPHRVEAGFAERGAGDGDGAFAPGPVARGRDVTERLGQCRRRPEEPARELRPAGLCGQPPRPCQHVGEPFRYPDVAPQVQACGVVGGGVCCVPADFGRPSQRLQASGDPEPVADLPHPCEGICEERFGLRTVPAR